MTAVAAAFSSLLLGDRRKSGSSSERIAEKVDLERADEATPADHPGEPPPPEGLDDHTQEPDHENDYTNDQDGQNLDEQEDDEQDDEEHNEDPPDDSASSSFFPELPRPSLPLWLVRIKDVLFASHPDSETSAYVPNFRNTPILSGSLIPFSILLEIPGLTEHWYVRTENNKIVESKSNTVILDVGLGISMACAVAANIALVTRFMERRVKAMTIACILLLTIHDLINMVTVLVFGVEHRSNDGFTYGEAYWMTVCSTIVSLFVNITLIWDLVTTPNFATSGSGLTRKQRSLVIITIIFLSYVALGALLSALVMDLSFLDGLFFTICTTLTIGFGDIVPITAAQRIVICIYASFGIIILGAAVRIMGEAVLEGLEVRYRRRVREYRRRRHARRREEREERRWCTEVEKQLIQAGKDVWVPDPSATKVSTSKSKTKLTRHDSIFTSGPKLYLNIQALSDSQLEAAAQAAGVPLDRFKNRRIAPPSGKMNPKPARLLNNGEASSGGPVTSPQESDLGMGMGSMTGAEAHDGGDDTVLRTAGRADRKEQKKGKAWWKRAYGMLPKAKEPALEPDGQGMAAIVKAMEQEEKWELYAKLILAWTLFFIFWTMGAVIFSHTESWTYASALYFCFIAFTTIGYGDLAPVTPIGRSIFIFWALLGVGAMTILFSVISDAFSSKYRSVLHNRTFDSAIKRYRQAHRRGNSDRPRVNGSTESSREPKSNVEELATDKEGPKSDGIAPVKTEALTLEEAEERLNKRYEPLPTLMLEIVNRFRRHMQYFAMMKGHSAAALSALGIQPQDGTSLIPPTSAEQGPPEELKKLLDEITAEEGISARVKDEVWQDEHARNTLFILSMERGIRRMIDAAEKALEALAERDRLRTEMEKGASPHAKPAFRRSLNRE